jgi:hypothetical protein
MRKRLITPTQENIRTHGEGWLDIERAAIVEVTSEDQESPIEFAFNLPFPLSPCGHVSLEWPLC